MHLGAFGMARRLVECTPLLGPGFHTMTMSDLHALAVAGREGQHARQELFTKLERFVSKLDQLRIPCDLWVDGSFLTEASDPADVDIAVRVMDDVMQCLTSEQEEFLSAVGRDDCSYIAGLDTFVFAGYWVGHDRYGTDSDDGHSVDIHSWGTQFGKGNDNWLKGIAVVPVMETGLGLRIRS
jgi:hypothetical protein